MREFGDFGFRGLTRRLSVLEFWCFVGGPKDPVFLLLSVLMTRACSKVVLRSIRIAESGVRFSSGPQIFLMDVKSKTAETYDKIASAYSGTRVTHFWVDEFDFFKSIFDGNKVIDFGCGEGRDAIIFIQNGFEYTGIDISEGMLKIARERAPAGVFQRADFNKVDFPAGTFDGFWAAASFIHVPKKDVGEALREVRRVTKMGGTGFISMKEKGEMDEGMVYEERYGGMGRYFAFYTQDEFRNILEANGFAVLKSTTHPEGKNNWLCYFVKVLGV